MKKKAALRRGKLTQVHIDFCRLRLEGKTTRMLAEHFQVTPETIRKWLKNPLITQEYLRQAQGGAPTLQAHEKYFKANAAQLAPQKQKTDNSDGAAQLAPQTQESDKSIVVGDDVAERGKHDLFFFAKEILGYDWLEERIHGPLCRLLQDPETTRAVVMLPRGWLKSTICSVSYPIWRAVRDPNVRILIVQNTLDNAELKLASIGSHFEENERFKALYPHLLPTPQCVWQTRRRCVPRTHHHPEPTFSAAGVRTRVVSRHYDVIIEDDTAAPELDDLGEDGMLLPTADQVKQAIGWHNLAQPLLTDIQRGTILIVGTRWFEHDLISYVLSKFPNYKRYERAAIERDGQPDEDGELVWPERFDRAVLDELKASLGPYFFSALYLNNPLSSTQLNFKPEWIRYYTDEDLNKLREQNHRFNVYTTVDLATDPTLTKSSPDWSAIVTTAKDMHTGHIYVLEYVRERVPPKTLVDLILQQAEKHNPIKIGIEINGYQRTMLYALAERMAQNNVFYNIEPIMHTKQSKEHRIMGLQPVMADGKLHFQRKHAALIQELMAFPRGRNDDIIDALSMQLNMWGRTWHGTLLDKPKTNNNPFLLDNILKSIEARINPRGRRPVFDIFRRQPTLS